MTRLSPVRSIRLFRLAVVIASAVVCTGNAVAQERPPASVTVVTVKAQDITLTSTLPGRVVASGVAEVRPQVAGIITERLYEEGASVELGDALYKIDPATYQARVAAAKAAVKQAQASLNAAQKVSKRQKALLDRKVTSQQTVDTALSNEAVAAAALDVAKAQLLTANIDLDRTTIRAPLSGKVGLSLTTQGALVTASQSAPLTVIRKLDPVYVDVTESAAAMLQWQRKLKTEPEAPSPMDQSIVVTLADGLPYEIKGSLTAAEPHVNEQTGVILLRLTFPNPDGLLLPGMYVQVDMPQGIAQNVVLAPQEGVARDRRGNPIAMVVNKDNVVEQRALTVLRAHGAQWVVSKGLVDGDRVIVEGLQKIAPKATVQPQERSAAPVSEQN
ncbi:efflux RND transporter periplasmic adaptor subunit [Cohaesibacter celericrescens]|uniref:Efflux RND transporter periplasmic adaptor subunit n=1 Tax=Cohaesibacter celericrescens TaxID=2067669 RepID=A0A2N5XS29_9HYPH|nr:efflux RND transporter periplasmic adaptor subunit [Cohaesibacter celericrescens]PLW77331.1 efflux RND transporter periplasmic adaptor subunit [Cohaesibacter celericrescens]